MNRNLTHKVNMALVRVGIYTTLTLDIAQVNLLNYTAKRYYVWSENKKQGE